jgi:hypothetical protein
VDAVGVLAEGCCGISSSNTSFAAHDKDPSQQMVDNAAEVAVKQAAAAAAAGKVDARGS